MSLLQTFMTGSSVNVIRVASFNLYLFIGSIDAKYNAVRDHINRVNADIIFLTEVSDAGYTAIVNNLAPDTGYNYTARGAVSSLGSCFMSKYPISNVQELTNAYVNAPGSGEEMPVSIGIARCQIAFNSQDLIIYGVHYEPWCLSGPCLDEERDVLEFPRAIQIHRTFQDIVTQQAASPAAKFIVMGDFNDDDESPQTSSFADEPSGIRGSFVLGSDITFPFTYATYPDQFLTGFTVLKGLDLASGRNTIWADDPNAALTVAVRLDYIAIGAGIDNVGDEILNSESDANTGLSKVGSPLASGLSRVASDHKLVFADLKIK